MEDFLGQEFQEGDTVLYAAMSGRSCNMVAAKVVTIRETSVVVEPISSARWKQHSGRTKFTDTRTGKGVNPDRCPQHIKVDAHMKDKLTGESVSFEGNQIYDYVSEHYGQESRYNYHQFLEYVPVVYQDYIKVEQVNSKIILTVTENIVKWNGDLPNA